MRDANETSNPLEMNCPLDSHFPPTQPSLPLCCGKQPIRVNKRGHPCKSIFLVRAGAGRAQLLAQVVSVSCAPGKAEAPVGKRNWPRFTRCTRSAPGLATRTG